jgi:type IV pilus assembly protein PilV
MPRQDGFSMIEVLVTMLILLIGLLGMAGMQAHAQRSEMESYQRIQALVLAQDMVARINANRKNAANYVTASPLGKGDSQPTSCSSLTGKDLDFCEWSNALKGAAETSSGSGVGAMVGARGCVAFDASTATYLVSVVWQGVAKTAAPVASLSCGEGLYGDETLRRVISLPITIATLT